MIQNLNAYEVISTSETKKTVVATDIKSCCKRFSWTLDPIVRSAYRTLIGRCT